MSCGAVFCNTKTKETCDVLWLKCFCTSECFTEWLKCAVSVTMHDWQFNRTWAWSVVIHVWIWLLMRLWFSRIQVLIGIWLSGLKVLTRNWSSLGLVGSCFLMKLELILHSPQDHRCSQNLLWSCLLQALHISQWLFHLLLQLLWANFPMILCLLSSGPHSVIAQHFCIFAVVIHCSRGAGLDWESGTWTNLIWSQGAVESYFAHIRPWGELNQKFNFFLRERKMAKCLV